MSLEPNAIRRAEVKSSTLLMRHPQTVRTDHPRLRRARRTRSSRFLFASIFSDQNFLRVDGVLSGGTPCGHAKSIHLRKLPHGAPGELCPVCQAVAGRGVGNEYHAGGGIFGPTFPGAYLTLAPGPSANYVFSLIVCPPSLARIKGHKLAGGILLQRTIGSWLERNDRVLGTKLHNPVHAASAWCEARSLRSHYQSKDFSCSC